MVVSVHSIGFSSTDKSSGRSFRGYMSDKALFFVFFLSVLIYMDVSIATGVYMCTTFDPGSLTWLGKAY